MDIIDFNGIRIERVKLSDDNNRSRKLRELLTLPEQLKPIKPGNNDGVIISENTLGSETPGDIKLMYQIGEESWNGEDFEPVYTDYVYISLQKLSEEELKKIELIFKKKDNATNNQI